MTTPRTRDRSHSRRTLNQLSVIKHRKVKLRDLIHGIETEFAHSNHDWQPTTLTLETDI